MPKMSGFLRSPTLTLLNVLGVLNVLKNVLNRNVPMNASLALFLRNGVDSHDASRSFGGGEALNIELEVTSDGYRSAL